MLLNKVRSSFKLSRHLILLFSKTAAKIETDCNKIKDSITLLKPNYVTFNLIYTTLSLKEQKEIILNVPLQQFANGTQLSTKETEKHQINSIPQTKVFSRVYLISIDASNFLNLISLPLLFLYICKNNPNIFRFSYKTSILHEISDGVCTNY